MDVYVDDIRPCPYPGWVVVRTYSEAIALLSTGEVREISLDHDLGNVEQDKNGYPYTGYDIACWIERAVVERRIPTPIMYCHSWNPVGRDRILQVIQQIKSLISF